MSQQVCPIISRSQFPKRGRGTETERNPRERKFQFLHFELEFRLFLGLFALRNLLAEGARMLSVESFHDRFAERRFLGVANDHASPCCDLEDRPMQADRTGKGQRNQDSGQPFQHAPTLSPPTQLSSALQVLNVVITQPLSFVLP